MKIIRIVTVSQHFSKVLQRHCIRQINQCSNIGIGLSQGFSPDPKRGEQPRSMVNEVVGRVHNNVMGEIWRRRPDVRPDLLLRLVFQLTESAHALAVFHPNCFGDHQALGRRLRGDAQAVRPSRDQVPPARLGEVEAGREVQRRVAGRRGGDRVDESVFAGGRRRLDRIRHRAHRPQSRLAAGE
jgi:hypothetical protein